MSERKEDVKRALIEGARNSKSEYVSVRREDLLLALGADERTSSERDVRKEVGKPSPV